MKQSLGFLLSHLLLASLLTSLVGSLNPKALSLFSIVQFDNTECLTNQTVIGSNIVRNGTCYTAEECSTRKGNNAGSCASGFGVCCLFIITASSNAIKENGTYLQNPNFPSPYDTATKVTYKIIKSDPSVCGLRLDFLTFVILGTGKTDETNGGVCIDTLTTTTTSTSPFSLPVICGVNSGQHMYLDIGENTPEGSASLNFEFVGTATRVWDIQVLQYTCGSYYLPPRGCLQFHNKLTGRIKTFNFDMVGDNHLKLQKYSVCIRPQTGYSCIQYSTCSDMDAFSLDSTDTAMQGSLCVKDYIEILGSSSSCNCGLTPGSITNKYCGNVLNTIKGSTVNTPICQCGNAFMVNIFTDMTNDGVKNNRGVCLDYNQVAC